MTKPRCLVLFWAEHHEWNTLGRVRVTPPPAASLHLEVVPRRRAEAAQQALARRVAAAVHLRRRQPEEGPRPGPAAVRVRQHLDLVQHPDLDARGEVRHLDGAGDVPSRGHSSHSGAPLYISLVILHTKYTGWRQNDINVHA